MLEWIIKKDVEGPSVSVAGFIFLLSEWISKPGMQHGECMARICQYLGASLGRARVELWAEQQGAWDVVGSNRTSDHEPYSVSPDQIEALLIDTKDRAQTKAVEFKTMGTGIRCALVVSGQRVAHPSVHDYLSKIRTVLPGAMSGLASE